MQLSQSSCWGLGSALTLNIPITHEGIGAAYDWTPSAPSGGGCFTTTKVSPHDDRFILVNNDMFGTFRTLDGGMTWEDLAACYHFRVVYAWAYHPTDSDRVFAGATSGFLQSHDRGKTWQRLDYPEGLDCPHGPHVIGFDRTRPNIALAVVFNMVEASGGAILSTHDGGDSWQIVSELPAELGQVHNLVFDDSKPGTVILGAAKGVLRTEDNGLTWRIHGRELVETYGDIRHFDGGSDGQQTILYATVPTRYQGQCFDGGIFRSLDGGVTWEPANRQGLDTYIKKEYIRDGDLEKEYAPDYTWLAVCATKPNVAYVGMDRNCPYDFLDPTGKGRDSVFRTEDGGKTWARTLWQHPDMQDYNIANRSWVTGQWGWQTGPTYLTVSDTNPNHVLHSNWNSLLLTENAGKTWNYLTGRIKGDQQASLAGDCKPNRQYYLIGDLDDSGMCPAETASMLTINGYHVSPHDPNFHYMSVTDFPGWFSRDAGKTWNFSVKGLTYPHDMYDVVFDPDVPGRLWACTSRRHDIPHWKFVLAADSGDSIYHGAIVRSDDNGLSWYQINESGLPVATTTDLYVDPDSPVESRHIWAAVIGHGLYFSNDGGLNWEPRNKGLHVEQNNKLLRINRGPDGKFYALSTIGSYDPTDQTLVPGGLFVSNDEGMTWQLISDAKQMFYPIRFAFNPHDPNEIFVTCKDAAVDCVEAPHEQLRGGLWKTNDGGKTWIKLLTQSCFDVVIHPKNENEIYVSTSSEDPTDGLFVSDDAGKTWQVMNCPAKRTQDLLFDPTNPNALYVTTWGGGAWRGNRK
ncbi:MAG: hypothetical protein CMJ19_01560 [Phycisphaeraceae bacterium]|nr:hypothetical protein [Phycisphaeraceae bacterium]